MTDDTPTTSDAEYIAVPVLLAALVAWPFFHPFHSTTSTVVYWVGAGVALICAALLAVGAILRSRAAAPTGASDER